MIRFFTALALSIICLPAYAQYGSQRFISLETAAGSEGAPALEKDVLVLDPVITADAAYAVIRDENGTFIPYSGTILWTVPDTGYSTYISITDSGNPCIVRKLLHVTRTYLLIGTLPSGSMAGGISMTEDRHDTLTINMIDTGYDGLVIRVASGFTVSDTSGTLYNFNTDIPSNRVIRLRANRDTASFAAYTHKEGESPVFPGSGYNQNFSAVWHFTDTSAFALWHWKTRVGFEVPVSPSYPVFTDMLIAEWWYGSQTYRDTVRFRVAEDVGIEPGRQEMVAGLDIYPNPFNPEITFTFLNPRKDGSIGIYDISGRLISRFTGIRGNRLTWKADQVNAGLFIVKAEFAGKRFVRKIVLRK
jgi:hypothetical protein